LKLWGSKIDEFKRTYPELQASILEMRLENEECWKKLNENKLDVAREELKVCTQTVQ
jgi:hypothetical protein